MEYNWDIIGKISIGWLCLQHSQEGYMVMVGKLHDKGLFSSLLFSLPFIWFSSVRSVFFVTCFQWAEVWIDGTWVMYFVSFIIICV